MADVALLSAALSPAEAFWVLRRLEDPQLASAPPAVLAMALGKLVTAASLHDDEMGQAARSIAGPRPEGVSVKRAARVLGLSDRTIRRHLEVGKLAGWREGARWVVDPVELAAA